MQMLQLNDSGWAKTYLIYDESSRKSAIIDPVYDYVGNYMEKISDMNLDLEIFNRQFHPECRSNQIIIFPSCLEHMVKKHSNSTTISGNILIEKLSK